MPASETVSPCRSAALTASTPIAASQTALATNADPIRRHQDHTLRLVVYQHLHELQELQPLWDDLVAQYPFASIFCTWEWLTSWWRSFGTDRKLSVLAVFDPDSRLIGIAPLLISTEPFLGSIPARLLRLMGDGSGDSDNLDLPVRQGFEEIFALRVFQYLEDRKDLWDICQFNTLPTESPAARHLAHSLKRRHWLCLEYSRSRSTVYLPETWDQYLDQLSPTNRKNFAYYTRRLHKIYSVRIYRCASQNDLPKCLNALFQLHQLHWQSVGGPGSFANPARREFYIDLSQQLLAKNRLELWVAELDGKIAAAQFGMRYGNNAYSLQEGYDPVHRSDRVGNILRMEVLKQLISEKVRVYDFLGGDDPHKSRWKAQPGAYRDLHFARKWGKGGLLLGCTHQLGRSKEWLRARLRPSAWAVLHRINMALPHRRALKPTEAA